MSTKLVVDVDEIALNIREDLDMAHPHIYGNPENARPESALKKVMAAWTRADLLLDYIDASYTHEIERFEGLRTEARKLILAFWQKWKLFPINHTDANGNMHTATVQVKDAANGHYIQPKPTKVVHKQRKSQVRLDLQQKADVTDYFTKIRESGREPNADDIRYIMQIYNISYTAAARYADPEGHEKARAYWREQWRGKHKK